MADNKVFECAACRHRYRKEADAEACRKWCEETKSCNIEIIKRSLEWEESASQD